MKRESHILRPISATIRFYDQRKLITSMTPQLVAPSMNAISFFFFFLPHTAAVMMTKAQFPAHIVTAW